jgi:hypothetical protein
MSDRSAPAETVLTAWVHISDVHFGHGGAGHQWDQRLITADLRRDAAQVLRDGKIPAPRQLFVTGDIAFSGNGRKPVAGASEYALARAWLEDLCKDLGIGDDHVYLVPGNHDVDRGVDEATPDIRRLVKGVRDGTEPIDEVFGIEVETRRLRQRMAAYLEFAGAFGPKNRELFQGGLWWRHRVGLERGVSLRICGLNTALVSGDDQDQGKLRVGNRQLSDLLLPTPEAQEVVIALSHHPLTGKWLAAAEEKQVRTRFDREAGLHLFGHLHEADSEQARHGWGRGCVRVAAGAAHAEAAQPGDPPVGHGYCFGALVLLASGELAVRIWPRRWSAKGGKFVADVENIEESKGFAEHGLGKRVAPLPVSTPMPVPTLAQALVPSPVTQAAALVEGVVLGGRYELARKLGGGGVGEVWEARDRNVKGEVVAVKVLNPDGQAKPERREQFFGGARKMKQVRHPRIVEIRDPRPDPEHHFGPYDFYVMDYVAGVNLRDHFERKKGAEAEAIRIVLEIAAGLSVAHKQGVIHRDLKPSNVILAGDGLPVIVDFDTVKDLKDGEGTTTVSAQRLATERYAAPEVVDGESTDARADVYSLALIAAFVVSGQHPPRTQDNIRTRLAALPCSAGLRAALARACQPSRERRYASVDEFAAALRALRKEGGGEVEPTRPIEPSTAPQVPSTTLVVLINVCSERDLPLTREKLAMAPDVDLRGARYVELHETIAGDVLGADVWRGLAAKLDRLVADAEAVALTRVSRCLVAGQAPLPVFAYLGQKMRGLAVPITFLNLRRGEGVWDRVERPQARAGGVFESKVLGGRGGGGPGRVVLGVFCSQTYGFDESMVLGMIEAEGGALLGSYHVARMESAAMEGEALGELMGQVEVALRHLGTLGATGGLTLAMGGPAWVAFWLGNTLNPNNFGGWLDFPHFAGGRYVSALAAPGGVRLPMSVAPREPATVPVGVPTVVVPRPAHAGRWWTPIMEKFSPVSWGKALGIAGVAVLSVVGFVFAGICEETNGDGVVVQCGGPAGIGEHDTTTSGSASTTGGDEAFTSTASEGDASASTDTSGVGGTTSSEGSEDNGGEGSTSAAEVPVTQPPCPPGQKLAGERCVEKKCGSGMKLIRGGVFKGKSIGDFCMDITEVTVAAFGDSVTEANKGNDSCNAKHSDRGSHPMNCVSWDEAKAHCAARGKEVADGVGVGVGSAGAGGGAEVPVGRRGTDMQAGGDERVREFDGEGGLQEPCG